MSGLSDLTNVFRGISVHPLTRDARMRAVGRIVTWQIRSRLQREVIVPWVGGQSLALRRGMTGATGNVYVGLHEFTDMMFLLHFLRREDLLLDIGANVGDYTVLASGACGAATLAFEPDPTAVSALKRNIEVNRLQDRVVVHEVALGATERDIAFTVGRDTKNRIATAGEPSRVVRQMPLDAYVAGRRPTFIKLDVEGSEADVLKGARLLLANPSLQVVTTETLTPEVANLLTSHQFVQLYYEPFQRMLTKELTGFPASNTVFVRDVSFVMNRVRQSPKIRILNSFI